MVAPRVDHAVDNGLKTGGLSAILLGALALFSCELPVILGILGLSTLAAGTHALRPPLWMEIVGVLMAAAGTLALVIFFIQRRRRLQEKWE